MKTPITKETIQNHMTYSLWKYALLAVVAIFGWNIIYSATRYQPPEEKKVIVGIYSAYANIDGMTAYMENIRTEQMPDMEDMSASLIMADDMYGDMVLSTRIAARECDIYILPKAQFQSYAAQGAFMPLEEVLPDLLETLKEAGISLSRGNRANDTLNGEKHQYGIPCADLPNFMPMMHCDANDMYLTVFFETDNNDNVLKFFDQLVRDMMIEPVTQ